MRHFVGGAARGTKSEDASRKVMTKRKYCSIPQYIQINNRELYDAMEDICPTLMGIFSMKSTGPNRPPRELTYLMPRPGSEMHKKIIELAYGGEQLKAIELIKTGLLYKHIAHLDDFKQGDILRTAARANVSVDTSGGFTKIGGAKIMADDNFDMLYTDAKFHVYLLESGIPMTSVDNTSATVSGGAWSTLHDEQKENAHLRTPAGLAKSALETHLSRLQESSNISLPKWIDDSGATLVFSRWGVSLARFFEKSDKAEFRTLRALVSKVYHPNPMCVIPFTALFVPKDVFEAWLEDVDDDTNYNYVKDYLPLCPKESTVSESVAGSVINATVASVLQDASGRRASMGASAKIIQDGYSTAYKNSPIRWDLKIVYDEALFIMNSYIRAALAKDWGKCDTLSRIIINHYSSSDSKSWLLATDDSRIEIQSGAMHCKLLECALSESMLYPNEYCKKNSRPAPVAESSEDSAKFTKLPAECRDFTEVIVGFFSKNT